MEYVIGFFVGVVVTAVLVSALLSDKKDNSGRSGSGVSDNADGLID